jgi:hypothetical protein
MLGFTEMHVLFVHCLQRSWEELMLQAGEQCLMLNILFALHRVRLKVELFYFMVAEFLQYTQPLFLQANVCSEYIFHRAD